MHRSYPQIDKGKHLPNNRNKFIFPLVLYASLIRLKNPFKLWCFEKRKVTFSSGQTWFLRILIKASLRSATLTLDLFLTESAEYGIFNGVAFLTLSSNGLISSRYLLIQAESSLILLLHHFPHYSFRQLVTYYSLEMTWHVFAYNDFICRYALFISTELKCFCI